MSKWFAKRLYRLDNSMWAHWLFIKHELGK
jgi:hypothetical protein